MGLLTGSASITRYHAFGPVDGPDFELERFIEIQPGSEVRERIGFIPFEPEAPYEVGARRYAFRVRIDKLRPDPTAVKERLKQLIHTEIETTDATFVGPKKRKQLRELAEEELIVKATPRTKIIECCLEGDLLYIANTSKNVLGVILELLRKVGVTAEPKAPWLDRADPDVESELVTPNQPGQSVLGCRFLKALMEDRELMIEGEAGNVRLATAQAKVSLSGAVLGDLHRYVERGCEILSAKIITAETTFRFDALSYRINGLRVETDRHDHWTELLDERLEKIGAMYELLDQKYEGLAAQILAMN